LGAACSATVYKRAPHFVVHLSRTYKSSTVGTVHENEWICTLRNPAWCPLEASHAMAPSASFRRSKEPPSSPQVVIHGFSNDEDLDKVWTQVVAQCSAITTWNLDEKKNPSIDDVLSKLKPSASMPEEHTPAKDIFNKALICVQRFGDVAASAAAVAFPPSQVRGQMSKNGSLFG
jgi:hypothetical protein